MLALAIAEERIEGLNFWDLEPGASSPSSCAANGPTYPTSAKYTYDLASAPILYEEFHPYGTSAYRAVSSGIEVSAKRYRYTGKERDEETGLDHMGARYYAGWLGRWTSADPIGLGDGVNRYAYVRGNPVGMRDPSGTFAAPPEQQQPKPILDTKRELSEAEQKKLGESQVSFGTVDVRTRSGEPKTPEGIVAEAVHAKFAGYAKAEDFSLESVREELAASKISFTGAKIPEEGEFEVKVRADLALQLAKRFDVSAGDTERLFPSLSALVPGSGLIDAPVEVKQAAEITLVLGTLYGAFKAGRALYQAARDKLAQRAAVREAAKETAQQAGAKASGIGLEAAQKAGTTIGESVAAQPTGKMASIVEQVTNLRLPQAEAAAATNAAVEALPLRTAVVQVGENTVVSSVQPGLSKPVLVVRPDGSVVQATADLVVDGLELIVRNIRGF